MTFDAGLSKIDRLEEPGLTFRPRRSFERGSLSCGANPGLRCAFSPPGPRQVQVLPTTGVNEPDLPSSGLRALRLYCGIT
jgi:hypothetical protein